jgi:hypothetical protein
MILSWRPRLVLEDRSLNAAGGGTQGWEGGATDSRTVEPSAVVGLGSVAARLAARLAASDDETLGCLRAATAQDVLVVLGPAAALPWVDGVFYLGRLPAAPPLYLPTSLVPDAPLDLLVRAVRHRVPGDALVALVPLANGRCELIVINAGPPLCRNDLAALVPAPTPVRRQAHPVAGGVP